MRSSNLVRTWSSAAPRASFFRPRPPMSHRSIWRLTLRGRRTAIVLSVEQFDQLMATRPSLSNHLLSGPPWDDALIRDIGGRDRSDMRDIDL